MLCIGFSFSDLKETSNRYPKAPNARRCFVTPCGEFVLQSEQQILRMVEMAVSSGTIPPPPPPRNCIATTAPKSHSHYETSHALLSLFPNTRHRRLPRIQGGRRRGLKKYSSRGRRRRRRRGWRRGGRSGRSGGGVEGGLGGQIEVEQGDSGSRSAVSCKVRDTSCDRGYGVRRTLPSCCS